MLAVATELRDLRRAHPDLDGPLTAAARRLEIAVMGGDVGMVTLGAAARRVIGRW